MSPLLPVIVHASVQGCSRAGTILPSLISRKWVNFFVTHCSTIATRTSLRCAVHCGILTLSTPPPVGLRARVWEAPRQVAKGAVGRVLHVTGGRWMIAMTVIKGMPLTATAHCWRARRQLQRRQGASGGGTAVSRSGRDDDHRKGGARGGRAYQRAHKAAHQRAEVLWGAGVVRVLRRGGRIVGGATELLTGVGVPLRRLVVYRVIRQVVRQVVVRRRKVAAGQGGDDRHLEHRARGLRLQ